MHAVPEHVLSAYHYTIEELDSLFQLAERLRPLASGTAAAAPLRGAVLGSFFFEPSTRTRLSFMTAFSRLGGTVCDTTGAVFTSLAKGESIADMARVVSGYFDAIVLRHPRTGAVREFAEASRVPVVNAGDGAGEHPTQALVDVYTVWREFAVRRRKFRDFTLAIVGDLDNERAVHSLVDLVRHFRPSEIRLVFPNYLPAPKQVRHRLELHGVPYREFNCLEDGIRDVDAIYAVRLHGDDLTKLHCSAPGMRPCFQINRDLISKCCRPEVFVLHPLPRDAAPDAHGLSSDLNEDERLAIFRQSDNGIPVRMAIFLEMFGLADQVEDEPCVPGWRASRA